jgi:hypothetical protein
VDVKQFAAFVMALVVSSLASNLKSWVTIDVAFTADSKVAIFQVCDKKIVCFMKSQGAGLAQAV